MKRRKKAWALMLKTALITIALLWGVVLFNCRNALSSTPYDQVREVLQKRIRLINRDQEFLCKAHLLCNAAVLSRFYTRRDFEPAWTNDYGVQSEATSLIEALHGSKLDGLRPEKYHLAAIEDLVSETQGIRAPLYPDTLAALDLLLTDAFLLYASHLSTGLVNPQRIHPEWFIKSQEANLLDILETALRHGCIKEALENLRPQNTRYKAMMHYLPQYENIMKSGGWPHVDSGPLMKKGSRGKRVAALRSRLILSGDLHEPDKEDDEFFDKILENAVRRFQLRHGLTVDAIVGPQTLAALNVPVEERIRQIKLNMERWRWLPHDFGSRYVFVNVANFGLEVVEKGATVLSMSGVVGRESRPTPIFTGKITYIELNPYWHIPSTIIREDVLPKILQDPEYLVKEGIRVFRGWKAEAREVDPKSVNWSQAVREDFPFWLRQDPGPSNALGRIKFMFPNKFEVYMHDTPARELFERPKRSFSSGCIRIEKPIELAEYILQDDKKWSREKILTEIDSGKNQIVRLTDPIDVHVLYLTAWVDKEGSINFRDDIYGRDKLLAEALEEKLAAY